MNPIKIVGIYLKEIIVKEEESVRRLDKPYYLSPSKAYYAIIDGKYFNESEIYKIDLSKLKDIYEKDITYEEFSKKYSNTFILCEAYTDYYDDKLDIEVYSIIEDNKYEKSLKIDRKEKEYNEDIKIHNETYKPVFLYETNELYYGMFLVHKNYEAKNPYKRKYYFEKKLFDKGIYKIGYFLPPKELEYINEMIKDKKYTNKIKSIIEDYEIIRNEKIKKIDEKNKKVNEFKKENKDLLDIIKDYNIPSKKIESKYKDFPLYDYDKEKSYVDDLIITINNLSKEDKKILEEVIDYIPNIINNLENIKSYLTRVKGVKLENKVNKIGNVVAGFFIMGFILVCVISLITNDGEDEPYYNQEWCASKSNTYQKCSYSIIEKRCVCKLR